MFVPRGYGLFKRNVGMPIVNWNMQKNTDQTGSPFLEESEGDRQLRIIELKGWEAISERLLSGKLEYAWEELLEKDSVAGFYQTPLWSISWYRHYHNEFEPLLLLAEESGVLIGLAALAIDKPAGRILFAGHPMADYRDFVCVDGRRGELVAAFLSKIMAIGNGSVFVLGQTQPHSETTRAAEEWANRTRGVWAIRRAHPCWRFRIGSSEEIDSQFKKRKTVRQAVSYYKRHGGISLLRVRGAQEWEEMKSVYFQLECLRRAFADRPTTFDDSRKQAFYEDLFKSGGQEIHFSVLRVGERLVSFMFCFAFRGVLYYGTPSFDPTESKHSPGILHILEVIRQCSHEGISEIDLTLGSSSFKQRRGNYCVMLPSMYIYLSPWDYEKARARKIVAAVIKRGMAQFSESGENSQGRWSNLAEHWEEYRRQPARQLLKRGLNTLLAFIIERRWEQVYVLSNECACSGPDSPMKVNLVTKTMQLSDYLTLPEEKKPELPRLVQAAVRRIEKGHILHTVLVDGRLVSHGWSCQSAQAPVVGDLGPMDGAEGSIWLYDFQPIGSHKTIDECAGFQEVVRGLKHRLDGSQGRLYLIVQSKTRDPELTSRLAHLGFSAFRTSRRVIILGLRVIS